MKLRLIVFWLALLGYANMADEQASAADRSPAKSSSATYRAILGHEADQAHVPVDIADAVIAIESGYDATKTGSVGEIGLMQVRPATAAMLGFAGTDEQLREPEVNIHYGVTYLAQAWRRANGDLCRALMKYRAGHDQEVMTPLSIAYCLRARAHLASMGSPFSNAAVPAGAMLAALPMLRGASPASLPPINKRLKGAAFWVAEQARVRAISNRIERRWQMMASRRS